MKFMRALCVGVAAVLSFTVAASAQSRSADGSWTKLKTIPEAALNAPASIVRPDKYAAVRLDTDRLRKSLRNAPMEFTPAAARPLVIDLPMPDGSFAAFECVEAPIMHPELGARYPLIRTYRGVSIADRSINTRFDLTPEGFHAMLRGPEGLWIFIDPVSRGDTAHYVSYHAKDVHDHVHDDCGAVGDPVDPGEAQVGIFATGNALRTYRLAVAATGEFTQFYGGTVASGLSAVVTAVNRTTQIFEAEFAIRFQLVANNNLLIYTDGGTDPYTNSNTSTMLGENVNNINAVIGSANYDIGHAFGTIGGGVANLGVPCGSNKARGVSSNFGNFGSPSTTLTVAHEIGHQFNSPHSWNGVNSSCTSGQWGGSAGLEPGSGTTILSYAGSCGGDNIATSRDAYFHAGCYDRITAFAVGTGACFTSTNTGNGVPSVNAGPDFTIPAKTPFTLTPTSASDPDNDPLTYCWEPMNAGPQAAITEQDNGASPIFRSRPPSSTPSRTIPMMSDIIAGSTSPGEYMPATSRSIRMRCTVRDNRLDGGGVGQAEMTLNVIGTAGPFKVTSPTQGATWSATRVVTWDVAGTDAAPISTANVRILLSTDNGNTFPTTLLASTPNTGSATVVLPSITASICRIKVEAVGNIYFAVSPWFSLTPPQSGASFDLAGAPSIIDNTANGNNNGVIDSGESAIRLSIPVVNRRTSTATLVNGVLSSLTPTATVVVSGSPFPNAPTNTPVTNTQTFAIAVSPSHPCGDPINLRLSMTSSQGSNFFNFSVPTGTIAPLGPVQTFNSGGSVSIPDNNSSGVLVPIAVSGVGFVGDIQVRFNGSSCSTSTSSTTVGVTHGNVGDLGFSLIAPDGTTVRLANAPGGLFSNTGNNICQLNLAADPTRLFVQNISGGGFFTGNLLSLGNLNDFRGKGAEGTWNLLMFDQRSSNSGTFRTASLLIRSGGQPVCTPPATYQPCNPADIADDAGIAPPVGANGGVNEGDYNAFFQGFFNASPACNIADDAGIAPPVGDNNGVNEGDYNAFFQWFFQPCV